MLTEPRLIYKPFEYEKAFDFWTLQTNAHWLVSEVSLTEDVQDWKIKLTDIEKHVVGSILKSFTSMEVLVGDYWTRKVSQWFPKPEIALMASCFGSMEGIHQVAYSYLNDTLGLNDYAAFLAQPEAKAKIDRLVDTEGKSLDQIATSLAVFSGMTEGVSLYSSFAILASFSQRNLLKGVGQIITFSVRDESLHSRGGIYLFNELCSENEGLREKIEEAVVQAARTTVALEDGFIEMAFASGDLPNLTRYDLKEYIRFRTNVKLNEMGYKEIYEVDDRVLERMQWFNFMTTGTENCDFFSQRVTEYAKCAGSWDDFF